MKKLSTITIALLTLVTIVFSSCEEAGVTYKRLDGDEQTLPDALKGLKVYSVSIGKGDYVKVAIMNGEINSTTYLKGKYHETILQVNNQNGKLVKVKEILMENDSMIVCRK